MCFYFWFAKFLPVSLYLEIKSFEIWAQRHVVVCIHNSSVLLIQTLSYYRESFFLTNTEEIVDILRIKWFYPLLNN